MGSGLARRAFAALVLCWFASTPAVARESCPFVRDPAFQARQAVPPAPAQELAIGTLNAYRLFDDQRDGSESLVLSAAEFRRRVDRIARYLARDMGAPAIIALEEIEDDTAAGAVAAALARESGRNYRVIVGDKSADGDIRNVLLVDARLRVAGTQSLFDRSPRTGGPQHDRRPLVVDLDAGAHGPLTLVVVHLKSMRGMDDARDGARVVAKRRTQAAELAAWAADAARQGRRLVMLGDFNALPGPRDDTHSEPLRILLDGGDLVDTAGRFLAPGQRWTYRYRCKLQQIDHVLVGPSLASRVSGYAIARGDTCVRAREKCAATHSVSDHEGVVLRLQR